MPVRCCVLKLGISGATCKAPPHDTVIEGVFVAPRRQSRPGALMCNHIPTLGNTGYGPWFMPVAFSSLTLNCSHSR